jgi:hypothetical protein
VNANDADDDRDEWTVNLSTMPEKKRIRSKDLTCMAFHWCVRRRDLPCLVDDLSCRNIIYMHT